ncbi:conserved protein of unknown function [Candidatus Hydrogenisulfobacillus filiaventi]|uniref:Uncharacterized protein n=1 Tax=Candidatus Hydrogenisulfobacillus filiaventi TaxID=2707344 RepID=A0A6F8ZEB0_9FIRM|nr:conserved protein of unknown function [Candidatus Hydrogenisulfobacillus filiaventi]
MPVYLHDEKPPVRAGRVSLYIDLVFWHPRRSDPAPLQDALEETGLGERSQTVFWNDKITVRLAMWQGRYWYGMSDQDWAQAAAAVMTFIRTVAAVYGVRQVDYDTRAFAVGVAAPARHRRMPLERLPEGRPAHGAPVFWRLELGPLPPPTP